MKLSAWSIPRPLSISKLCSSKMVMLGLGSSLGDRLHHLRRGLLLLLHHPQVQIEAVSSIWQTQPVGAAKNYFYNMCVRIRTTLSERALLKLLLKIEKKCGRIRGVHWMDRTLDLDILWYEGSVMDEPSLTIPHPRMLERAFVMIPLSEIVRDCAEVQDLCDVYKQRSTALAMWSIGRFAFVKVS